MTTKKKRTASAMDQPTIGQMFDALFLIVQTNDEQIRILDRRVKALHRSLKKGLRP